MRTEFLTPTFQSAELACERNPKGQLPPGTTNEQAANRITDIDHAGEDCRQKLDRVKMKVEVFDEIVAEHKANSKPKKKSIFK
jgi:hypothetical protein